MTRLAAYEAAEQTEQVDFEEIVEQHSTLVKRIAYHLSSRLPSCVQVEDLIQAGMIGLLDAGKNYSPSHGASFETYAGIRIRGSMIDEIRKGDWAPRSLHRKIREISQAVREIEMEHGRDAKDSEVAEKLDMPLDDYYHVLQESRTHHILSFDDLPSRDSSMEETIPGKLPGPLQALITDDRKEMLARAIDSLPEREKLVMSLYYDNELNLKETGEVLGVSESRVCQIHTQALIRLKSRVTQMIKGEYNE